MYQFHFLIPDPMSFPSGGNLYNHHLMKALAETGAHVSHNPYRPEVSLTSPDVLYILDSIYFRQITDPRKQLPSSCIGLIHHLESLFPLSEEVFLSKEKSLLDHLHGFLVSSTFTQHYLEEHGYTSDSITVVEPAPLIALPKPQQDSEKVHALLLGSCVPRKGQLEFLEALGASDVPPYYTITIAGSLTADVAYANACRALVLSHPVLSKCVRLTGELDPESIRLLYAKANLFLSSSFMGTYGMAIQDAVASHLPVLVLEGGYAAAHVTSDAHGVRCTTVKELVKAFGKCVTDREYFRRIRQGALDFLPPYPTWEDGARRLLKAYGVQSGQ